MLFIQREEFTPGTQEFLARLSTLCDSVLLNYLSKLADSLEKREHLCIAHTAVSQYQLMYAGMILRGLPRVLDLQYMSHSGVGREDLSKFVWLRKEPLFSDYLEHFLSNPGRSKVFHCDPAWWNTFVATRYLRYFRTASRSR